MNTARIARSVALAGVTLRLAHGVALGDDAADVQQCLDEAELRISKQQDRVRLEVKLYSPNGAFLRWTELHRAHTAGG